MRARQRPAASLAAARAAAPLQFKRPPLPTTAERERILAALEQHQVLIVAGETGSGKSTQLPQFCLELGRGIEGLIAHTQPRRLAARALAARIAEEVSQPLGSSVGFKVRFAAQVSDATRLLLMTDGLLLAELSSDPDLSRFDTLIVDEAHERSLNVDLLLGVIKGLLPRRPDLKVIVTSATLDVERIAEFFGGAPIIRVGGRGHPVEVRYREMPEDGGDPDLPVAVLAAYREIAAEPAPIGNGDVLVFLPGEREIRDVGEFLERELESRVEVLPLYSRLAWEQQNRIFQPASRPRIVLATNVAETSITVPGIRAVIDSGLARISRYSLRSRLQRLPIEPVSRAGAAQRQGRCGRLGPGLCLRLYGEDDFAKRPAFTEPEVLRTNLAALLLRLAADGLGDAESFPFIDAPDSRALNDGYRLLQELQALDAERRITRCGRAMARLPLDPRLGRALLESKRFHAESEVMAVVAGMSVPDVRLGALPEAPRTGKPEERAAQDGTLAQAAPFEDARSEFSALVKLWRAYRAAREGTRRELRQWCRQHRLSMLRLSEWDDVHTQLAERAREVGIVPRGWSASYTGVHRALLAGFCTLVGARGERGVYLGTRGIQFYLFPGSPLAKRKPRWVMAANIVETSRIFGRHVAEIEPGWIESAAAHLTKREFLAADWDESREEVVARERVSLLGLTLSANRIVNYGPIAPEESRRIFAREALVHGRLRRRPDWVLDNDAAVAAARRMEDRLRSRDLLQSAEGWVEFYDRVLPRQVSSAVTLDHFSRHLADGARAALRLQPADIFARTPDPGALAQFPEAAHLHGLSLEVGYRFSPGAADDGATLRVPLLALPQLTRADVQAAVPGLSEPRIEALLRSLPKDTRRLLIPIGATTRAFLDADPGSADLESLRTWLQRERGVPAGLLKFDVSAVPAHLNPQIAVLDQGVEIARGRNLAELRRHCAVAARAQLKLAARALYGDAAWRRFELDVLPDTATVSLPQGQLRVFPALAPRELKVELEWSAEEAAIHWREAAVRLARSMLAAQSRDLARRVIAAVPLLLSARAYFDGDELNDVLLQMTFRAACFAESEPPRTRADFEAAVEAGRERLHAAFDAACATLSGWLADAAALRRQLEDPRLRLLEDATQETRGHVQSLLSPARLVAPPPQWLRQLPRYLKAEQRRWQRNAARGSEAGAVLQELQQWTARLARLELKLQAELRSTARLDELRLWVEEFRVSQYAQELKTLGPISAPRLEQRTAEVEAWLKR